MKGRDKPARSLLRETTRGEDNAVIDSVLTVDMVYDGKEEVSRNVEGGEVVVRIQLDRDHTSRARSTRANKR